MRKKTVFEELFLLKKCSNRSVLVSSYYFKRHEVALPVKKHTIGMVNTTPGTICRLLLLVIGCCISTTMTVYGQREVLYEQYQQSPLFVNPAFTGIRDDFNMTLQLRRRWFTYQNAPVSQTFSADGTVANGKVGLGLQILNDRNSIYQNLGFSGSGSYIFQPSPDLKVSVGIQGGINILPVYNSQSFLTNNKVFPSLGAGVWVQHSSFHVGLSVPEILSQSFGNSFKYNRPAFLIGSYYIRPDANWLIQPNAMIAFQKQSFSNILGSSDVRFDIGSKFWYNERIGVGVTYRATRRQSVAISGELQASKNIRVGYIFNSKAHEARNFAASQQIMSMHEIMLKIVPSGTFFHLN